MLSTIRTAVLASTGIDQVLAARAEIAKAKATGKDICINEGAYLSGYRMCPCSCGSSKIHTARQPMTDVGSVWHPHASFALRALGTLDLLADRLFAPAPSTSSAA